MTLLHPIKSVTAVQPRYVGRFSCTGPQCEDNCCTGWRVSIDRKTFNAYRQVKHPVLSVSLDKNLKRNRTAGNDDGYGRIEMEPATLACPFLQDKLCGIQRELGEDKLSNTCATYPRTQRSIDGQHEQVLTLSCPEAARLALLSADALELVEDAGRIRISDAREFRSPRGLNNQDLNEVRIFTLQLMRTRDLELWQRLAVLALFCEQLTQLLKASGHRSLPSLLDNFRAMVEGGAIQETLAVMPPDHDIQAIAFSRLWQFKMGKRLTATQLQVQQAVARGLGADAHTGVIEQDQLIERYTQGVKRLPEAMKEHPFLLENYLVNEMFREVFPFGEATAHAHFMKLITRFGLVRLMLAAQCSDGQSLPSPEQMARTIQVFCRHYQHDSQFATLVNSALDKSGWSSLEKLYRFLRT